jgi:hypothetical protein
LDKIGLGKTKRWCGVLSEVCGENRVRVYRQWYREKRGREEEI